MKLHYGECKKNFRGNFEDHSKCIVNNLLNNFKKSHNLSTLYNTLIERTGPHILKIPNVMKLNKLEKRNFYSIINSWILQMDVKYCRFIHALPRSTSTLCFDHNLHSYYHTTAKLL